MDAQETTIYTAVLITALVLGIIIAYFFISIIRQQRHNLHLQKQNIIDQITQIEKERSRIATDLHDDLGPLLAAVKMNINNLDFQEEDMRVVEKTNHHLDDIISRLRAISFDLMPTSLIRKGLAVATQEFINYLNHTNGLEITHSIEVNHNLTEEQSINLYRIIQEVIHNAIKHAEATQLQLAIASPPNKLVLTITDNGKGFNPRDTKDAHGFGLRSLLNRAEMLDGEMFLQSETAKGTKYTFEIPV